MPKVLKTTPTGQVDPLEQATVDIYQYQDAMRHRETARIAVDGGEVHLDIYPAPAPRGDSGAPGDSAKGTLIFVGGMSNHALGYADFEWKLSMRNWNVVALDLRGHGRSSGKRGDFTVETVLDDFRGAIDYAKERFGGPIGFMGTSLGGYYSLCAANAIDDIQAAVSHWIFLPDMPVTKQDARIKPIAIALSKVAPWMKLSTLKVADWEGVSQSAEIRQRCFDDPMMVWKYTARAMAAGLAYDPPRPLAQLRVPTLVVIGEEDRMTPLAHTQKVFDRLQGDKQLVTIPGAGHMGGLCEFQDEMLGAVDDFFSKQLVRQAVTAG